MNKVTLIVNRERCPQKHLCKAVKNCPMGALQQDGKKAPTIDSSLCNTCGTCTGLCPKKVFVLEALDM
jgi:heterodisulfide reductase subunit A-like polyferredoxin